MMLLLYVMPMWINFVLRTRATKTCFIGLASAGTTVLTRYFNQDGLQLLAVCYLPLYATMQKMDQR